MAGIEGTDPRVKEIIEALGISLDNLQEVVIHFKPDDIIYADAIYIVQARTTVENEPIQTIFKRYRLEEMVPSKPFSIGKKVRIKPEFIDKDNATFGRLYYLTVLGEQDAVIKWDNLIHSDSKPFTIELFKIEMV